MQRGSTCDVGATLCDAGSRLLSQRILRNNGELKEVSDGLGFHAITRIGDLCWAGGLVKFVWEAESRGGDGASYLSDRMVLFGFALPFALVG